MLTLCMIPLRAQMHKVEAPERVTRAISVYEWTGTLPKPTAARLIPVSVFIDGKYQDGGVAGNRRERLGARTGRRARTWPARHTRLDNLHCGQPRSRR